VARLGARVKLEDSRCSVAIRALAHKLARASYHVMKDQIDFDPNKAFA
jgi:hypothetical protein